MLTEWAAWLWARLSPLVEPLTKVVKAFMATIAFVGTFLYVIIDTMDVGSAFQGIADSMNAAAAMIQQLPIHQVVGQINRVAPLNEFLVFTSVLLGLKATLIGFRIIVWLIDLVTKIIGAVIGVLGKIPL